MTRNTARHLIDEINRLEREIDRLYAMTDQMKLDLLKEKARNGRLQILIDQYIFMTGVKFL